MLRGLQVLLLPDNYWHQTCNLVPYTVGIGGQVWSVNHLDAPKYEARPPPPASNDDDGANALEGSWQRRGLNQFQREILEKAQEGVFLKASNPKDEL